MSVSYVVWANGQHEVPIALRICPGPRSARKVVRRFRARWPLTRFWATPVGPAVTIHQPERSVERVSV